MRKWMVVPVLVVTTVSLVACGLPQITGTRLPVGSGRTAERTIDFRDFDAVVFSHAANFEVVEGDYGGTVSIDENLAGQVLVEMRGRTLHIGMQPGMYRNYTLRARVSMPALRSLEASGAASGHIEGFSSDDDLTVNASGASRVDGNLSAGNLRAVVSGASRLTLAGSGANLDVNASGASTVDLANFPAQDGRIEASGASRATVNVAGQLDAAASGASTVRYVGEPENVRQQVSGASSIGPR